MRFHLLGLTHLPASKKYMSCAFTQKNRKLVKMLTSLGHTVYFYSPEGSDIKEYCKNEPGKLIYVPVISLKDIRQDYGEGDNRFEIGYNFFNQDYKHDLSSKRKPSTLKFYQSCISRINKIKKDDDFLLCTQGQYHKPIADAVGLFLQCESGIGYRGWCESMFHCFESDYIRNFLYGSQFPFASLNGRYYDRTIGNYFDPNDIEYSDQKDDYFLFIGRLIKRKGILTAYLATKAAGKKLIIAGQGGFIKNGHLVDNHPQEFDIPPDSDWEYIGYADIETRKKLMAHAKAVFVPTEYLECFAGVHIESMLSGTAVITTDFGVFPGTVINGVNGYRCNTLQDFVDATRKVEQLDPKEIRKNAERFLMDNVKLEYQKWFNDLMNLYISHKTGKQVGWHKLTNG